MTELLSVGGSSLPIGGDVLRRDRGISNMLTALLPFMSFSMS